MSLYIKLNRKKGRRGGKNLPSWLERKERKGEALCMPLIVLFDVVSFLKLKEKSFDTSKPDPKTPSMAIDRLLGHNISASKPVLFNLVEFLRQGPITST